MDAVGIGLMILGFVLSTVGNIWILILAFRKHIGWGIAALLLPFVGFIFVVMNWNRTWKPFLIYLLSVACIGGGYALSPTMQKNVAETATKSASP